MVRHRSAADPNHNDLNALPADTSTSKRKAGPLQRTPQSNNTQQKFYHQRGYSGRPLKANGMQDAPEVRDTLYVFGGGMGSILIPIPHDQPYTWVRIYDYNTDAGLPDSVIERHTGYQVLTPDSVTGSNAGLYARHDVADSVKIYIGRQDTLTVACDLSLYADTVNTPTRIVETTLSRRVIYTIIIRLVLSISFLSKTIRSTLLCRHRCCYHSSCHE